MKKKKPAQFSKVVCVIGLMLIFMAWFGNFLLLLLGKEQMSDVTVTMITVFGGFATGGYYALTGFRDNSKNKHAQNIDYKYEPPAG